MSKEEGLTVYSIYNDGRYILLYPDMSKASKKLQFVIFDDIESILAHLQSTNDVN